MADFSEIVGTVSGSAAWSEIQNQLSTEGASDAAILAAKDTLASTWTSLTTNQFGVDPETAMVAAKNFTLAAQTISGSIATVNGLLNSSNGSVSAVEVVQISNMFVGTMIGLAAALGAVSAGVGAVIVSALAIAADVLESFLGSSPGVEVCPGVNCNPAPDWVINCRCVWGKVASPGSSAWRKFPTSSEWFTKGATAELTDPITGRVNMMLDGRAFAGVAQRPIDMIFPQYAELERGGPVSGFHSAFMSAWKANQEYALNGLKVQDDSQVLLHLVRVWNRSHSPGTPYQLSSATDGYEGSLVNELLYSNSQATDLNDYILGSTLLVYTGPSITFSAPAKIISLHLRSPAPAPTTTTTAVKGTALAVGGVTLATIVYSWAIGKSAGFVLDKVWDGAKSLFNKPVHVGEALESAFGISSNPIEGGEGTAVQTLLFSKARFDTASAKSWARKHGYTSRKVDLTSHNIRLRQHPPEEFRRMRTVRFAPGVQAVIGWYK